MNDFNVFYVEHTVNLIPGIDTASLGLFIDFNYT